MWDGYGGTNDHVVPHLGEGQSDQLEILHGSFRKPPLKLELLSRNIDDATIYGNRRKEESYLTALTKKTRMLEKGPWSETPDGVFQSCDSDLRKEAACLAQDARMSQCSFMTDNVESACHVLSAGDAVLDDKSVLEDNVFQYPLNHMSKTDNELGFLNNEHETKEKDDILDYGWLDIENFEDVDRMFRNCDSTFGIESLNNDGDLYWLPSSHDTEVSNDALKSNLKFTSSKGGQLASFLDYNGDSKVNNLGSSVIDSSRKPFTMEKDMASGSLDVDAEITADEISASGLSSVTSEGYIKSDFIGSIMAKEQRKQPRHQKVLKGSGKDVNIQNDNVQHCTNLKHFAYRKHPYAVSFNDVLSSENIQQLNAIGQHGSLSFVQEHGCFMHSDQSHALVGTSPCQTFSTSKTGNSGHSSYSLKESSYASYDESTHGYSSENSTLATNERREKLYYYPKTQVPSRPFNSKHEASAVPSKNQNEGHREIEIGFRVELESPNAQESSSMSSELEDISVEATSFRQLQKVMGQLDVRTKLCIRDSLYRLAKSAEQRHNYFKGDICKDTMPLDDARCNVFVDMETETNPIDRSIARLLFHRPSDPSSLPASHVLHLKSNAGDEGPIGVEQKSPMDDDGKQ